MSDSSSDIGGQRRTGLICSQTGEKLGTIVEESPRCQRSRCRWEERHDATPTRSATFHALRELPVQEREGPSHCNSDQQLKSTARRARKRSLFHEMGERIRLFSTASFVSSATPPSIPKTQSLDTFHQHYAVLTPTDCEQERTSDDCSYRKNDVCLSSMDQLSDRAPSQLGMLCQHCSAADLTCSKAQQELSHSPSVPSLYSLAPSDLSSNDPLCRICHCCWPSDPSDPLISPCRCSGSLQYVHVSCLMHWLDISSRKLHRPAICELCLYKYRRRRVLKYREIKLPDCASRDVRCYTLFLCALLLMVLSATATVVCFQMEKGYSANNNRTATTTTVPSETTLDSDTLVDIETSNKEMEALLSHLTLISALVFFCSFFLAMYAHVKSGLSLCNYLVLCWSSNLEWCIEEYKHSRDSQYLSKLEELRRKINEKQKKSPDEVEPLRSSVIIIE